MKTEMMEPHLRKTIALVDSEIKIRQDELAQLTTTRKSLIELGGGDDAAGEPEKEADQQVRPTKAPRAKSATREERPAAAPVRIGKAPDATSVKLMAFVRSAPEPFTAASLAVGTGLETKDCANRLFRWMNNGIVEKVARGEFRRAANFPASAPEE